MRPSKRTLLLALCIAACAGFSALGVWQLQRLAWKLDLIARVDARIHASPAAPPARAEWPALVAQDVEYRRIRLDGRFENDKTTLVDALTEQGPGAWLITPLVTSDGTVLVNRGFVPREHLRDVAHPEGTGSIVGLLRLSEPDGRFLRPNRPQQDTWYSRDVAAIAAARGLHDVAPFFVDAERTAGADYPIGGLTVVRFRNMHAVYAFTWFALAGMAAVGVWRVLADDRAGSPGPSTAAPR